MLYVTLIMNLIKKRRRNKFLHAPYCNNVQNATIQINQLKNYDTEGNL